MARWVNERTAVADGTKSDLVAASEYGAPPDILEHNWEMEEADFVTGTLEEEDAKFFKKMFLTPKWLSSGICRLSGAVTLSFRDKAAIPPGVRENQAVRLPAFIVPVDVSLTMTSFQGCLLSPKDCNVEHSRRQKPCH
jgi:hypothetical protein